MYSWGDAKDGALGLEDDGNVLEPTPCPHFNNKKIKTIASNISHTLILLDNGVLYSCGNKSYGQLGREDKTVIIPAHVDSLETSVITKVDCGIKHSMAITSEGVLYSWGDNSEGQLGIKSLQSQRLPSILSLPIVKPVVHVACGRHHTLALTQDGRVFSWGSNTSGQLGHSRGQSRVIAPSCVSQLESAPIVSLVAGGDHSVALTVSGAVFVWGNNKCGQLGLGHVSNISDPTLNDYMYTYPVTHVACGDDHTVFQLQGGTIYTVGSNQYGQLGRGKRGTLYPRPGPIMSLVTTIVQQVVCGRYHTVLLSKYTGEVISFGQGELGQLGIGVNHSSSNPVLVRGMWSSPKRYIRSTCNELPNSMDVVVKRIYAGGDHTFATTLLPEDDEEVHPVDLGALRMYSNDGPCYLTCDMLKQMLHMTLFTNNYTNTLNTLQMFFSSPSCVNGSFLIKNDSNRFQSSFIDYTGLQQVFVLMRQQLFQYNIDTIMCKAFSNGLLANLPDPHPCEESLRLFFVVLSYPLADEYPGCLSIIVTFVKVFLYISNKAKDVIATWLFKEPEVLLTWIKIFKAPITRIVASGKEKVEHGQFVRARDNTNLVHLTDDQTWALQEGIKVLRWLYECNRQRKEPIPYQTFYIDEVVECCDLWEDYNSYKTNRVDRVLFMRYSFVLNVVGKAELIQIEGKWRMMEAIAKAHQRNFLNIVTMDGIRDFSPSACVLHIRRTHLLQDSISGFLSHSAQDLLKPLRVEFEGEEGVDDGGVQKEYFMLLIKEILNPDFGMFFEEEESKLIWFREQLEPMEQLERQYYQLIGMICSLAIYNGVIVDLPFPVVLYKKLLNMHSGAKAIPPNLDDLRDLKPSVGKHLKELLTCDGSVFEEQYGELHFELSRNIFGSVVTIPLKPDGSSIAVTVANRKEYVNLYVQYELVTCVEQQFKAFAEGFTKVCNIKSDVFENVHPDELLSLVTGSSTFDINEFKEHTTYHNKYYKGHPVVERFWTVVCDFSLEAKKKLLVFWTGTNRVPVAGVKSLKLIIQFMDGGHQCQRLPVAHTCSNILDLPPYDTLELMKEKLLRAIYFTEGFGIV